VPRLANSVTALRSQICDVKIRLLSPITRLISPFQPNIEPIRLTRHPKAAIIGAQTIAIANNWRDQSKMACSQILSCPTRGILRLPDVLQRPGFRFSVACGNRWVPVRIMIPDRPCVSGGGAGCSLAERNHLISHAITHYLALGRKCNCLSPGHLGFPFPRIALSVGLNDQPSNLAIPGCSALGPRNSAVPVSACRERSEPSRGWPPRISVATPARAQWPRSDHV